jgi:hypothetical protein
MIRVLIASVCLFFLEVYLFCTFSPTLLDNLTKIDIKYLTFTEKQRRAVHGIQRLNALHSKAEPAIYVLGGSTSREFFPVDHQMTNIIELPFVNMGSANQTLIDSLRLADNIKGKATTLVYCLFPLKFMRFKPKDLPDSRFLMGAYLKYPIESPMVYNLLKKVAPRNLATGLVEELNVYCYLLKNYFLDKNRKLTNILAGKSSQSLGTLFVSSRPPIQHFYHRRALNRGYLSARLMTFKKEIGPNLEKNLKINFAFLGHLVKTARNNQVPLILVELPYSSTFERLYRHELDIYRRHRDAFLRKHAPLDYRYIEYSDFQGQEELFYDHGHLLDRGRAYFHPFIKTLFEKDHRHANAP